MQTQTQTVSFCRVCFDEAAYEEQNSRGCWLLTRGSALPAVTSGGHYSRRVWKLSVSLSLGTAEGQSPWARNARLRHAHRVFPRIERHGGAGYTKARWCQEWQIKVYINTNGEHLRPHQQRSKGTALFMLTETNLIWKQKFFAVVVGV